jgi:hypothetical protein
MSHPRKNCTPDKSTIRIRNAALALETLTGEDLRLARSEIEEAADWLEKLAGRFIRKPLLAA